MDDFNLDIAGRRRIDYRHSIDVNEDSTIERLFIVGGGKADYIYNRMMNIAFPKINDPPLNIMNELQNKAVMNLNAVHSIPGFNGLFGLHDNIFKQKFKGPSDLIF